MDMIRFLRIMLSSLKLRRTKNSKRINLKLYLDYGALNKKHLDSVTDFINRHEKFKASWEYTLKVLLHEALIKVTQVTLKFNRLQVEFYLNGIVAGTECDEIFWNSIVLNSSEPWYV